MNKDRIEELLNKVDDTNKIVKSLERNIRADDYRIFNILNISENLSTIKDKDVLIRTILLTCKGLMQSKYLMLFVINREKTEYEFSDKRSLRKQKIDKVSLKVTEKLNSLLGQYTGNATTSDILVKENILSDSVLDFFEKKEIKYLAPIFYKEEPYGFFVFSERYNNQSYSHSDIELLSIIGNQTVTSIENIYLFNETLIAKEQLEKAYEELKAVDKLKDNFLSLISHELNTPLTGIVASVDTLSMIDLSNPEEKEFVVSTITESSEALKNMIDKILLLSKLSAEKIRFIAKKYDINLIISEVIELLDKKIKTKNQKIIFEENKDLPEVIADNETIIKTIEFIIDNAIEYSPENDGVIQVKAYVEGDKVIVSVKDNGMGIKPENKEKIFDRFEQEIDIMAHGTGIGLSLPICKEIIERGHNNKIWFESVPAEGTEFYFSLDIAK